MRRNAAIALVAAACAAGAGGPAGSSRALEVATAGRIVWQARIGDGEPFDLAFSHSSERCVWTQHYRATTRGIWQDGSTFPCFGPGMPSASTDGSTVTRAPGGYLVSAPRLIGELSMLGWRAGGIVLIVGGRTVPLGPLVEDFEPFTVSLR